MDALRDSTTPDLFTSLLDSVRVRSTIYCRSSMGSPWGFAVEAHGNPSFHLVVRGDCWVDVDGVDEAIRLQSGDLVVLPRGPRHALRDEPTSPTRWLDEILDSIPPDRDGRLRYGGGGARTELICGGFLLEGEGVKPLLERLPPMIRVGGNDGAPVPWVRSTLDLIGTVTGSDGAGAEVVLRRLSDTLLAQALRVALVELEAADPAAAASFRDPQIAKAVDLIQSDPARDWTVEELAAEVAYSRSAFASRFRELVGESPMSYLTRTRLAIAAMDLDRGDDTIAAIARRVGYASESSFSRAFKRVFGVAPGAYRENPAPEPLELTSV
ncbi:MAG TPA: AraC family transcriptional regulator [Gaiellaceae bacterium]|nr:AraC family transcriptional regulator [Gaiellaceae bacterium]